MFGTLPSFLQNYKSNAQFETGTSYIREMGVPISAGESPFSVDRRRQRSDNY